MQNLKKFLDYFSRHGQVALPAIQKNHINQKESFEELAEIMLTWAKSQLDENWIQTLVDGYFFMLMDMNRSQIEYEDRGEYSKKSFDDVYDSVYNDEKVMDLYHWGVYVCNFAWEHHVEIYNLYRKSFLPLFIQYSISSNTFSNGRCLNFGIKNGTEQNVHLYGHPRLNTNGTESPYDFL